MMTENQYKIADRVLALLKEHGGRVNMDGLRSRLNREFSDRESYLDRELVLKRMEEQGLVGREGIVLFSTWKGEKAIHIGMEKYEQGLGIIEWWKDHPVAAIISSVLSGTITFLVTMLLSCIL